MLGGWIYVFYCYVVDAALDLSTSLRSGRDDRGLGDWLSPRLSFRPEKAIDFGAEKSFLVLNLFWSYG